MASHRFQSLLPQDPITYGEVLSHNPDGTSRVELPGGDVVIADGTSVEMGRIEPVKSGLTDYRFKFWGEEFTINPLLFAILGIELSRSWLKIREFVLDTYVLIVPLGLAIQKVGCLMAGCCSHRQTRTSSAACFAAHARARRAHRETVLLREMR